MKKKQYSLIYLLHQFLTAFNILLIVFMTVILINYNAYLEEIGIYFIKNFRFFDITKLLILMSIIMVLSNIILSIFDYFYNVRTYLNTIDKLKLSDSNFILSLTKAETLKNFDNIGYLGTYIKKILSIYLNLKKEMTLILNHRQTNIKYLAHALPFGLLSCTVKGKDITITLANDKACQILNIENELLINQNLILFLNQDSKTKLKTYLDEVEKDTISKIDTVKKTPSINETESIELKWNARKDTLLSLKCKISPIIMKNDGDDYIIYSFLLYIINEG